MPDEQKTPRQKEREAQLASTRNHPEAVYQRAVEALAEKLFAEKPLSLAEADGLEKAKTDARIPIDLRNRIGAVLAKAEAEGRVAERLSVPEDQKRKAAAAASDAARKPKLTGEGSGSRPGPGPAGEMPKQLWREKRKLIAALKKGDRVWFERDGQLQSRAVNDVTEATVMVEVPGEEDFRVYKKSIKAVEPA